MDESIIYHSYLFESEPLTPDTLILYTLIHTNIFDNINILLSVVQKFGWISCFI